MLRQIGLSYKAPTANIVSKASFRWVDKWRLKIYGSISSAISPGPRSEASYQGDRNQKYDDIEYKICDTDPKVLGKNMATVLPEHYRGTPQCANVRVADEYPGE